MPTAVRNGELDVGTELRSSGFGQSQNENRRSRFCVRRLPAIEVWRRVGSSQQVRKDGWRQLTGIHFFCRQTQCVGTWTCYSNAQTLRHCLPTLGRLVIHRGALQISLNEGDQWLDTADVVTGPRQINVKYLHPSNSWSHIYRHFPVLECLIVTCKTLPLRSLYLISMIYV